MNLRWPGIEPGSTAWKATMLTSIPPSLVLRRDHLELYITHKKCILRFIRRYCEKSQIHFLNYLYCKILLKQYFKAEIAQLGER